MVKRIAQRLNEILPCYTLGSPVQSYATCNPDYAVVEAVQIEGHTDSTGTVDGGLNPRINGAGQNIGTEFAVIPPEQKDWTVSPLSTPLAARGGGRRPAFTGG